jgi:hypothetical protein
MARKSLAKGTVTARINRASIAASNPSRQTTSGRDSTHKIQKATIHNVSVETDRTSAGGADTRTIAVAAKVAIAATIPAGTADLSNLDRNPGW